MHNRSGVRRPTALRGSAPRRGAGLVVLLTAWCVVAGVARASVDPTFPNTDGAVHSQLLVGDTLYVGGAFARVGGSVTGGLVVTDSATGSTLPGPSQTTGSVYALAADGQGGWYVGGDFASIGGVARANLAHVRADGTLDAWNPGASSGVLSLAVSGGVVYAAGCFAIIGGELRHRIAAIDAATGVVLPWDPDADDCVRTLAVSGTTVYAGGGFTSMGGQPRSRFAAIDATSGAVLPLDPGADSNVNGIVADGSTVYVGGEFTSFGGEARAYVAAFDSASGGLLPWNPGVQGAVLSIARGGSTLFAAGLFVGVAGVQRMAVAAIDAESGALLPWVLPSAYRTSAVNAVAVDGNTVYLGGNFGYYPANEGGRTEGALALDASTGAVQGWAPGLDATARAFGVGAGRVCVGGDFKMAGLVDRNHLAAIDMASGSVLPWKPATPVTFDVSAMAYLGSTLYAGGTSSGTCLSALDRATGAMLPWSPALVSSNWPPGITNLAASGTNVGLAGNFTKVAGQAHAGLAVVDAVTGVPRAWNLDLSGGRTYAMGADSSSLYVGGAFTSVGGISSPRLVAVDLQSGSPRQGWDPLPDETVGSLALQGNVLYISGPFTHVSGFGKQHAAAVLAKTGDLVQGWSTSQPSFGDTRPIAALGSKVWVFGNFSISGGPAHYTHAAVDAATGAMLADDMGTVWYVYPSCLSVRTGDLVTNGQTYPDLWPASGPRNLSRLVDPASFAPQSVALAQPGEGSMIGIGSVCTIQWLPAGGVFGQQSADVYVSRSGPGGPWELIAAGICGRTTYDWRVTGPPSSDTYLRVDVRDWFGAMQTDRSRGASTLFDPTLGVAGPAHPFVIALAAPYPNPVRDRARFTFTVPATASLRLSVLDVKGREVAVLAEGPREAGRFTASFDARALPPGVYLVRLKTGAASVQRKLVIIH